MVRTVPLALAAVYASMGVIAAAVGGWWLAGGLGAVAMVLGWIALTYQAPGAETERDDLTPDIELTWSCHVCGRERPDAQIDVHKTDLSAEYGLPPGTMEQNVRYCTDDPDCRRKAPEVRFGRREVLPLDLET